MELAKAIRCYALEKGAKLSNVTEDMLEASDLGVKGWAKLYESRPAAAPKPGNDGTTVKPPEKRPRESTEKPTPAGQQNPSSKPAPSTPAPSSDGGGETKRPRNTKDNTVGKKEKEVKELLAQEQSSDNMMSHVAAEMNKDPGAWSWAKDLVASYKGCRTKVVQLYAESEFYQAMKVAALSSKELAKVKKDFKSDYLSKLVEFITVLGPRISDMQQTSLEIYQMSAAKKKAVETLEEQKRGPVPKARGKARAKSKSTKNKGSTSSLEDVQ